eukprot:CAMPEP_0117432918 /NCGR_PEP_ID=MMETSP0758-20121206/12341_1 /TAXON_ID=63605 /ORGANISM="Percolomonas cosmopolitus, Strain AE-1 (ATCC 50343)" /LENGTH=77 /DNA_ID=CAMNT_0005223185 /DNA_START=395 /DNA_END=625 /DNA_ORIENTATION=+
MEKKKKKKKRKKEKEEEEEEEEEEGEIEQQQQLEIIKEVKAASPKRSPIIIKSSSLQEALMDYERKKLKYQEALAKL